MAGAADEVPDVVQVRGRLEQPARRRAAGGAAVVAVNNMDAIFATLRACSQRNAVPPAHVLHLVTLIAVQARESSAPTFRDARSAMMPSRTPARE